MSEEDNESYKQVKAIRDAKWEQCSVFYPSPEILSLLPAYMKLQPDECLVIATQTCSVVSGSFIKEPLVEVLAARPLDNYNPRHARAKGNENVYFHLPIQGHLSARNIKALECDLGRRAFLPRSCLASIKPEHTWCELSDLNAFKGWIANYYTRIALPDTLVRRLTSKPDGLVTFIEEILKTEVDGGYLSDYVKTFYVEWFPNEEVSEDKLYEIELVVVCTDTDGAKNIDTLLSELIENPQGLISINKVLMSKLIVDLADNITLSDLYGKVRFNEWDRLSSPEERLHAIREDGS